MDISTLLEVTYDGDKGLRIFELCNFIESQDLQDKFVDYLKQQVIDCADSHDEGVKEWENIVREVEHIERDNRGG